MAGRQRSRLQLWHYLLGVFSGGFIVALVLLQRGGNSTDTGWPDVHFVDVTDSAGIRFTHEAGLTPRKLLPESMGSGVAVIDFDRDGKPDLLFVNSCHWPGQGAGKPIPRLALYHNRGGSFEDVTRAMHLDVTLFGMGVTVGDYDNDGWPDLFITAVGGNRLFRNERGKFFRDVTTSAGVGGTGGWPAHEPTDFFRWKQPLTWSTSASFLDYDGDGWLDLFVCNYLTWSPGDDAAQAFRLSSGERAYGPPRAFPGAQCFLYRNLRDGQFLDVSRQAGIEVRGPGGTVGKSLGVVVCDVDQDGWPDVLVANDTERNFFFHNVPDPGRRSRRFEEIGELTGVAYADRVARGAMGIDWGPAYDQQRNAVLIGNFADEPNTFLVQQRPGELRLIDLAPSEGVAGPGRSLLKFGLFFFDHDLDGKLDFLTCNGHLEPDIHRALPQQTHAQPVQLYSNRGAASPRYVLVPASAIGPDLLRPLVGRGCAFLDFDGDGALDVVLTANAGQARLLRNVNRTGNHWLRLRLEGDGLRSNTSAIGARVVVQSGKQEWHGEVVAGRGYLSQSETVLTFGLGQVDRIDRVIITWPGARAGAASILEGLEVDREHVIRQGHQGGS